MKRFTLMDYEAIGKLVSRIYKTGKMSKHLYEKQKYLLMGPKQPYLLTFDVANSMILNKEE